MATEAGPSRAPAPDASIPSAGGSRPKAGPRSTPSAADPVLRNALRYTISAKEYETLHKYVLSRSRLLRKKMPSASAMERYMDGPAGRRASNASEGSGKGKGKGKEAAGAVSDRGDTYNAKAVRHALRIFLGTALGLKTYEAIMARVKGNKEVAQGQKKPPMYKSTTFRLSLSLSTILLMYRLLFRFLQRLRASLLDPSASPWRDRNPRAAIMLTSRYAPAVGASLAGLALGIYPSAGLRASVALTVIFRAFEFAWDLLEGEGMIWGWKARPGAKGGMVKRERPWWWGSWMVQPFALGQLWHSATFDPDCAPTSFIGLMHRSTTTYLHPAPADLPTGVTWPSGWDIQGSLAEMAKLKWPPFVSPTLFPDQPTLPPSLSAVGPLSAAAHPLMTSLSCATLHPSDPSCLRTYLSFWVRTFPRIGRFFLLFYSVLMLPQFKLLYHAPVEVLNRLLASTLRMTAFLTGALGTSWASVCLSQAWLPRHVLATQRFFLGGFLGGLWAFLRRRDGRSVFLWHARTSADALWKVGVKRRWWRALAGGEVWVFVAALAITGAVHERNARAIKDAPWRKGMTWMQGDGFRDWGIEDEEEEMGEGGEGEGGGEGVGVKME